LASFQQLFSILFLHCKLSLHNVLETLQMLPLMRMGLPSECNQKSSGCGLWEKRRIKNKRLGWDVEKY